MVGKIVKLFDGYRFFISEDNNNWSSKKVYSSVKQAHTIMISVMEFGNFSDWTEKVGMDCEQKNNKELALV